MIHSKSFQRSTSKGSPCIERIATIHRGCPDSVAGLSTGESRNFKTGGLQTALDPRSWGRNPKNLLNSDKTRAHISVFGHHYFISNKRKHIYIVYVQLKETCAR